MIIDGNVIRADEGKTLRRISDKMIMGDSVILGYIYYLNGEKLENPHLETVEDYEELSEEDIKKEKTLLYSSLVEQYIREMYSVSDELAIQRQKDEKQLEFKEYFKYCESCKKRAKKYLNL